MPLHLDKVQRYVVDPCSPLVDVDAFNLTKEVFSPEVLASNLTSQERTKLFSLLPDGDRTMEGLMSFLGDMTQPATNPKARGGPSVEAVMSLSSSSSRPSELVTMPNGFGMDSDAVSLLKLGGEFCPGPLLLDAVQEFQELLRCGHMEPETRQQARRLMASGARSAKALREDGPPTGRDYEACSRGRCPARYPAWKERKHAAFWAGVDSTTRKGVKALPQATQDECTSLETAFARAVAIHSGSPLPAASAMPAVSSAKQAGSATAAALVASFEADHDAFQSPGKKWSDLELGALVNGVRKYGGNDVKGMDWAAMRRDSSFDVLLCRTATSVRDKWRAITGSRSNSNGAFPKSTLEAAARVHRQWVNASSAQSGQQKGSKDAASERKRAQVEAPASSTGSSAAKKLKRTDTSAESSVQAIAAAATAMELENAPVVRLTARQRAALQSRNERAERGSESSSGSEEEGDEPIVVKPTKMGYECESEGSFALTESKVRELAAAAEDPEFEANALVDAHAGIKPLSKFTGVFFQMRKSGYGVRSAHNTPWRARVGVKKQTLHLGYYKTQAEAALAIDLEVLARRLPRPLNFPPHGSAETTTQDAKMSRCEAASCPPLPQASADISADASTEPTLQRTRKASKAASRTAHGKTSKEKASRTSQDHALVVELPPPKAAVEIKPRPTGWRPLGYCATSPLGVCPKAWACAPFGPWAVSHFVGVGWSQEHEQWLALGGPFPVVARKGDSATAGAALNHFSTELEAALAYDRMARSSHLLTNFDGQNLKTCGVTGEKATNEPNSAADGAAVSGTASTSQEVPAASSTSVSSSSSSPSLPLQPPPLPSSLRLSAWLAKRVEDAAVVDQATTKLCDNCSEPHNGLYGSGRFCCQRCRSCYNGQKSSFKVRLQRSTGMSMPPDVEKPRVFSSSKYSPPSTSAHDGAFGYVKVAQRIGISMDGVCAAMKSTTSSAGAAPSRVHGTRLRTFLSDIVAVEPENHEDAEIHSDAPNESSIIDGHTSSESSSAASGISQGIATNGTVPEHDSNTPLGLVAAPTGRVASALDEPARDNHSSGHDGRSHALANEGETAATSMGVLSDASLHSDPATLLPFTVPVPGEAAAAAASVAAGCLI